MTGATDPSLEAELEPGPGPGPAAAAAAGGPVDGSTLADAVAAAVRACPVVVALDEGGGTATHLPGRRVDGVRVGDDADGAVEVAVVLRLDGRPLPELADEVRAAVSAVLPGRPVDVLVGDVVQADGDVVQADGSPAGSVTGGPEGTDGR